MMTGVTNAMAVSSGALAQVAQKEATIDIGGQYWWRPTAPSYTNNELYMDVVETINCIVDEQGTILGADVTGDISVISRLSGPCPHALLTVRNPHLLSNGKVQFHPSVDVERWHAEQKMSFIPADGQYSLCTYYIPILPDPSTRLLPLQLDLKVSFDRGGGHIDFTARPRVSAVLSSKAGLNRHSGRMQNHRPPSIVVDDVVVSILLPTCIASGSLQTTVKSHIDGKASPSIRLDTASDGGTVLIWHVGQLASNATSGEDTIVVASGKLSYDAHDAALAAAMASEQRCIAQVGFTVRGWCISGLRLDGLEVSSTKGYIPRKGCRYSTVAGLVDFRVP